MIAGWKLRLQFGVFVLILFASTGCAFAKPTVAWCAGCTQQQREQKARTSVANGEVYVGETTSSNVYSYLVTREYDSSHTPPLFIGKQLTQTTPDPEIVQNISTLRAWYNTAPVGWVKTYAGLGQTKVDYRGPGWQGSSVYDFVVSGPAKNNLQDWVAQQAFFMVTLPDRIIQVLQIVDLADEDSTPKSIVTVTFDDGSTLDLEADLSASPYARFKAVKDSGRDKNNNTVMSARRTTPILFEFDSSNSSDYTNWMSWMNLLGYNMNDANHGAGHLYACTSSPAGYFCVLYMTQ